MIIKKTLLLYVITFLLIFVITISIIAIILEQKKNTETFKTIQRTSKLLLDDMEILPGTILVFAGTSVPDGYLLCDGKVYSSIEYPDLYNAIGTNFGIGDIKKSTDFNVPNLIDKYMKGGNLPTATLEGQDSFIVKSENIDNINPNNSDDNNIPATTNLENGACLSLAAEYTDETITLQCGVKAPIYLKDIKLQLGVTNPVAIDNRPETLTLMYIIKYK
jgi:microcystin-dependent protein